MEIVTDENFEAQVLKSTKPVLVDFFAQWCGPCRQMLPVVADLSEEMKDDITLVKMDVDESTATPNKYNVQSIPCFIVFKDGVPVGQKAGSMSKQELKNWILEFTS